MAVAARRGVATGPRAAVLDRRRRCCGRSAAGATKGSAAAVASGRAALGRCEGRAAAPGDRLRPASGAHDQPRARGRRPRPPSTDCSSSRSRTGTSRRPATSIQVRVTAKGDALVHVRRRRRSRSPRTVVTTASSADSSTLPTRWLHAIGISDHRGPGQAVTAGKVPPGRGVPPLPGRHPRRRPGGGAHHGDRSRSGRLRVVDLGCGNAYLTFAAYAYLTGVRGLEVDMVGYRCQPRDAGAQHPPGRRAGVGLGVAVRQPARSRRPPSMDGGRTWCWRCTPATPPPTRRWPARSPGRRPVVLAAPCCHHDIQRQLVGRSTRRRRTGWPPGTGSSANASPTSSPMRCAPRCFASTGTGWRSSSSWRAGTRRGTRCCGRCAPARPVGRGAGRLRRRWWRSGGSPRPGGACSAAN